MMMVMKFELLPNEVLCLCFQYFDVLELFDAFDGLNQRFSQLIRRVPLYLNFEFVCKSIFDNFCTRLLSDDQIRNQIYALKLSNHQTLKEIEVFLSKFTLDQFPCLQSLELDKINQKNIEQLNSILPLVPELCRLCILNDDLCLLKNIPISKLKVLSISSLTDFHDLSLITHLSIGKCTSNDVTTNIFRYLSVLKYLRIANILGFNYKDKSIPSFAAIHLKRLIFDEFFAENFEGFTEMFRHTPNLINLTMSDGFIQQMHADKMQEIFESFLPLLSVFKFNFFCFYHRRTEVAIKIFDGFQSDFWHQHQWFTEYVANDHLLYIYTIPNPVDNYETFVCSGRFPTNHINAFDNVRSLKIDPRQRNDEYEFYFAQIEQLQLVHDDKQTQVLRNMDLERLKSMVNFADVKHLQVHDKFSVENPSDWIELFHQMPKLRELTVTPNFLKSFLECSHLYGYLNDRIRILNILEYEFRPSTILDHVEISKLREMFSNIETYFGWLNSINDLIYLMKHFAKISMIEVFIAAKQDPENEIKQLEHQLNQFNAIYDIKRLKLQSDHYRTDVRAWL